MVATHFGRCPEYPLATTEDGSIIDREIVTIPGHQPGFLPKYLSERNIDVIVAGGMGARAQRLFEDAGIDYLVGITGPVEEALRSYAAGKLEPGEDLCSP